MKRVSWPTCQTHPAARCKLAAWKKGYRSTFGIMTSDMIRSGGLLAHRSSASSPSRASTIVQYGAKMERIYLNDISGATHLLAFYRHLLVSNESGRNQLHPTRIYSPSTSIMISSFRKYRVLGSRPREFVTDESAEAPPESLEESMLLVSLSLFHCIASSTIPCP